ncbi:MAG: glucose-6-phosphate isomerase [Alphaproteobacteria bacterium]
MPNKTAAWKDLQKHCINMQDVHMRDFFAKDVKRFAHFHVELDGFLYDYSKNRVTSETITLLEKFADECGLKKRIKSMLAGEKINVTENRAALHMALRGAPSDAETAGFIIEQLDTIKRVSERIRTSKKITDIVHIGTGGSDLGPRMICGALAGSIAGPTAHFVNNIDGDEILGVLRNLKPENTIFIIASKGFSTAETLMNAGSAKNWLMKSLDEKTALQHFYAVTQNIDAAKKMGITPDHILPLRDWTGGRFSLWSSIGVTIAIARGFETFKSLLDGASVMDRHFLEAPFDQNIPVLMALLSLWYRNFWDFRAHAVVPYASRLNNFPAYIQQLEMESNGKFVNNSGEKINYATASVIIGDVGTNAQHAFFQMFHQGSDIIPCDLIVFTQAAHDLKNHHIMLVCNALAQGEALMLGFDNAAEPHRHFDGNRPSSTLLLEKMDARHLGMLIAAYEHKIFVQGALWNINSFDQWGVELGKTLASELIEAHKTGKTPVGLDSSTAALLGKIHK